MTLTPDRRHALRKALLSAFPNEDTLEQMVFFELGERLDSIAGGQNLSERVFNLIKWAEVRARTEELIQVACTQNPGNIELQTFMQEVYPHLFPLPRQPELCPPNLNTEGIHGKLRPDKPVSTPSQQPSPHILYALARAQVERDDRVFVGKTYTIQAGVSWQAEEGFVSEPAEVAVEQLDEPLPVDILLHESEQVELLSDWQQRVFYQPGQQDTQLVDFLFRAVMAGDMTIAVDFYHKQRWLRTITFTLNAVAEAVPASAPHEDGEEG